MKYLRNLLIVVFVINPYLNFINFTKFLYHQTIILHLIFLYLSFLIFTKFQRPLLYILHLINLLLFQNISLIQIIIDHFIIVNFALSLRPGLSALYFINNYLNLKILF